jgi:hypothetical protein
MTEISRRVVIGVDKSGAAAQASRSFLRRLLGQ